VDFEPAMEYLDEFLADLPQMSHDESNNVGDKVAENRSDIRF